MKKNTSVTYFIGLFLLTISIFTFSSCEKNDKNNPLVKDAFNNGTSERNMIVVISDIHMGADLAYAEFNENMKPLENLLAKIEGSANVKELVIAGDLLDEWFVPANVNTYKGKDQRDFVQRIAASNKSVFDAFQLVR
jgi:metallophosphoesterase superfamily enzyme